MSHYSSFSPTRMKYCTCMFCVIIYEQRSLYLNISTNIAPPASCAWPWWCDCHSTLAAKLGLSQLQSRHSWKLWSHLRTENIARTSLSLKFAFQHVFLLTRVSTPGEDDVDRTFRCWGCPVLVPEVLCCYDGVCEQERWQVTWPIGWR